LGRSAYASQNSQLDRLGKLKSQPARTVLGHEGDEVPLVDIEKAAPQESSGEEEKRRTLPVSKTTTTTVDVHDERTIGKTKGDNLEYTTSW
jgi:hypothetical protein